MSRATDYTNAAQQRILKLVLALFGDAVNGYPDRHSVVAIEHDLYLIAEADWIIDLGPEGDDAGGQRVGAGTHTRTGSLDGSRAELTRCVFVPAPLSIK